jgi:hypothetical protein
MLSRLDQSRLATDSRSLPGGHRMGLRLRDHMGEPRSTAGAEELVLRAGYGASLMEA